MKYIQRIDTSNTHGWQVRLCYKSSKITHSKMFSDKINGGKRKALKLALEYRDNLLKELGLESYLNNPYRPQGPHRRNCKNTSGIIGVTFTYTINRYGETYYNWTASFQTNGKQHHKTYGVNKYGDCKAFRLACKKRFETSGPLKIYRNSNLPCRVTVKFQFID